MQRMYKISVLELQQIECSTYVDTILSPALAIVAIAMNCADCPLDAATAAAPPSSAARRFSNTSCEDHRKVWIVLAHIVIVHTTVGFPIREYMFPRALGPSPHS